MDCHVDPNSLVPPSQQIVACVLDAVARGTLRPGDKLPSVRGLAAQALVNPNTVTKAYRDLEHAGATAGKNGSGVFVTERGPEVARELRLVQTLDGARDALRQALRAGHARNKLVHLVEDVARRECVGSSKSKTTTGGRQ